MRAKAKMNALQMALTTNEAPIIPHSERGGQYIYGQCIKLLTQLAAISL
jgi:hypothetical protein